MCIRDSANGYHNSNVYYTFTPDSLSKDNIMTYYIIEKDRFCLLYTSDAADERSSVDLGGRRIIKKKK